MKNLKLIAKRIGIFLAITVSVALIGAYSIMWVCVNGPSWVVKDMFVMSVRETSAAGFLANIYCSKAEIQKIVERNQVKSSDTITDVSIIKPNVPDDNQGGQDNTDKDEFVSGNPVVYEAEGIRVEQVSGSTYKGVMMLISDPSRVFVGTLDSYDKEGRGKTILEFIKKYGVSGGSNAGGFYDPGGSGKGGYPKGIVISEGRLRFGNLNSTYEVIGFTNENILVVGNMTAKKALELGIRDAVTYGPILMVNGVPEQISGIGGGLNPRTAIGQRADGTVLLLVIDGRQASSLGASYFDLINVFLEYEAVNAANLDGGSSSVLYHNGNCLNVSSSLVGMRPLPTAILIK